MPGSDVIASTFTNVVAAPVSAFADGTAVPTSAFADGTSAPSSTFAAAVTAPASTITDCGLAPISYAQECVALPPVITSLTPSTVLHGGDPVQITIRGSNFLPGAIVAISGTLISILSTTFVNTTTMAVTVLVDEAAALGARNLTVTTPVGTSGAAVLTVTSIAGLAQRPAVWVEADYQIADANLAAITSWHDRSGNGRHITPSVASMLAPIFHASGFGGIAALPYIQFRGTDALKSPSANVQFGTFTMFVVGIRDTADSNGSMYEHGDFLTFTGSGMRDRGFALYTSRGGPLVESAKEKSNPIASWIPKNVRQICRHEFDGTHAGHKMFINGVDQALINSTSPGFAGNPGTSQSPLGEVRLGARAANTPSLHLTGSQVAVVMFSPKLSTSDTALVEAYLAKWLAGAPAAATRGPILLATQVIDGVTVDVLTWASSGTPDFTSLDAYNGTIIIRFSEAIKRFRGTLVVGHTTPGYRPIIGVRNFVDAFTWDPVVGDGFAPGVNNQEVVLEDSVTGFTHVVSRLGITGGGTVTAILKDCYFSKMSDP